MKALSILSIFMASVLLIGCGTRTVDGRRSVAFEVANQAGFTSFSLSTNVFRIAGFYNRELSSGPASIYIEGDGFAWIDRHTISSNPTPKNALGLKLATYDTFNNVIYLARPCQFVDISKEPSCHKKYWTSHRFSTEILKSYMQALDLLKGKFGITGYNLVGFSGGGAVAVLLAEQRSDILTLTTVAGNLDHVALNRSRNVSPLSGSLDPIRDAFKLKDLPQVHYWGSKDDIIPSWVSQGFVRAVGNNTCAQAVPVTGASHIEGWLNVWQNLSQNKPHC